MTPEEHTALIDAQRAKLLLAFADAQRAYQLTFNTVEGNAVLLDLAPFWRASESCGVPGDRDRTWALIGRNEVYQRIRAYLDLTPEQLVERYTRPAPKER